MGLTKGGKKEGNSKAHQLKRIKISNRASGNDKRLNKGRNAMLVARARTVEEEEEETDEGKKQKKN